MTDFPVWALSHVPSMEGIDTPWEVLATVVTVFIVTVVPVVGGMYAAKVKRAADSESVEAASTEKLAQDGVDLEAAVLSLTRQMAQLEASMEPIVKYRYPRAIEYIALLHEQDASLEGRAPVPVILRDDVDGVYG